MANENKASDNLTAACCGRPAKWVRAHDAGDPSVGYGGAGDCLTCGQCGETWEPAEIQKGAHLDETPHPCAQCAEDARDDSNLCTPCENRAFGIAEEEDL